MERRCSGAHAAAAAHLKHDGARFQPPITASSVKCNIVVLPCAHVPPALPYASAFVPPAAGPATCTSRMPALQVPLASTVACLATFVIQTGMASREMGRKRSATCGQLSCPQQLLAAAAQSRRRSISGRRCARASPNASPNRSRSSCWYLQSTVPFRNCGGADQTVGERGGGKQQLPSPAAGARVAVLASTQRLL